tara:strand:- start:17787 stop:23039 length:5253 start_codon:yes stop_codon:yes gene_type:complete
MAITSSGEIKFSDLYKNQNETSTISSGSDMSLDSFSDAFANAAVLSNSPTASSTLRTLLGADEDRISHFYSADYPGTFESFVLYRGSVGSNQLDGNAANDANSTMVEGETLVMLAIDNSGIVNTAEFEVVTDAGSSVSPAHTDADDTDGSGTAYVGVSLGITPGTQDGATLKFKVADDDSSYNSNFADTKFRYRDSISGHGTTNIQSAGAGATYQTFVSESDQYIGPSGNGTLSYATAVTTGTQFSSSVSRAINVNGDGGNIYHLNLVEGGIQVLNTPGKMTFTTTHYGYPDSGDVNNPNTRNTTTSTAIVDVPYTRSWDDVAAIGDGTFNAGDSVTMNAVSKGADNSGGSVALRVGWGTSNSNTTFTDYTAGLVNSLYSASTWSNTSTSLTATGTGLTTYYPKAYYLTGGDQNLTAGSGISVAPTLTYSTTGNTTIDINNTQAFVASVSAGNGASVAITSSPNIGSGTNSATMTPGSANGVYTISFAGTSNYSQTNNQTDTLTVRPTVSLVEDSSLTSAVGFANTYSTGLTPTGISATSLSFTATAAGDTISTNGFTWTIPSGFSDSSETDNTLAGNFSGTTAGSKTFGVTASGNGTTSTQATVAINVTLLGAQSFGALSTSVGGGGWVSSRVVRRGASNTLRIDWQSKNVAKGDICLGFASVDDEDFYDHSDTTKLATVAMTSDNTDTDNNYAITTPALSAAKCGLYDIMVFDFEGSAPNNLPQTRTSALQDITIIDKAPTTTGAWTTAEGSGYVAGKSVSFNASTYAAYYQLQRSSDDVTWGNVSGKTTTGTSITLDGHSTNTTNYYYRMVPYNDNSYVDDNGGASTSDESGTANASARYQLYPDATNSKNVISAPATIFRTTLNNSTDTTLHFNSPTNATDNVVTYAYSDNTAVWSISDASTSTALLTATGTAGTGTVTLDITCEGGSDSDTTSATAVGIALYHYPAISAMSLNKTSLKVGVESDQLVVEDFTYQGFRQLGASAMNVVIDLSDGSNTVGYSTSTGNTTSVTLSNIDDSHTTEREIVDEVINLGYVDAAVGTGTTTAKVRFTFQNHDTTNDPTVSPVLFTTSVSLNHPNTLTTYQSCNSSTGKWSGGYSTPEGAFNDTTGGGAAGSDCRIYGDLNDPVGDGTEVYKLMADGSVAITDGANQYYHNYQWNSGLSAYNNDVMKIGADGGIDEYYDELAIPPDAISSLASSQTTTGASVSSIGDLADYTYGANNDRSVTITGKATTKTVAFTWTRNSSINDAVGFEWNNGGYSALAANSTGKSVTSVTNGSYTNGANVRNSRNGVNQFGGAVNSGTITVNNDATLYFGAYNGSSWKNLGTTTGTGPFTFSSVSLEPGSWTIYCKYGGYPSSTSGNLANNHSFTVSANDALVWRVPGTPLTYPYDVNISGYQGQGDEIWWIGGTSVESGELSGTDDVEVYFHINDTSNNNFPGTAGSGMKMHLNIGRTGSAGAVSTDGTTTLRVKLQNQTATTEAYSGFSGAISNEVSALDTIKLWVGGDMTDDNSKAFVALGMETGITAEGTIEENYVIKAFYNSETAGLNKKAVKVNVNVFDESGGTGTTCFALGTKVWMNDGTWKNIEDVTLTDSLKSMNIDGLPNSDNFGDYGFWSTGSIAGASITDSDAVFNGQDYYYDHYEIIDENDNSIKSTYEHPFLVYRDLSLNNDGNITEATPKYCWVRAKSLDKYTDKLVNSNKELVSIKTINYTESEALFVKLDVEDNNTYFVKLGDNAIAVHNAGKAP